MYDGPLLKIVGTTHCSKDQQSVYRQLKTDQYVVLQQDPFNEYDRNAIKVHAPVFFEDDEGPHAKLVRIGFIKKELTGAVHNAWKGQKGSHYVCRIVEGRLLQPLYTLDKEALVKFFRGLYGT